MRISYNMSRSDFIGIMNPVWEGEIDWKDYTRPLEFDVAVAETGRTVCSLSAWNWAEG